MFCSQQRGLQVVHMVSRCLHCLWSFRPLGQWWHCCRLYMPVPFLGTVLVFFTRRVVYYAREHPARSVLDSSVGFMLMAGSLLQYIGSCKLWSLETSERYQEKLQQNQLEKDTAVRSRVHLSAVLIWVCLETLHLLNTSAVFSFRSLSARRDKSGGCC